MGVIGTELFLDDSMSVLERMYCRVFGVPIVGLRIRVRRLMRLLPTSAQVVLDAGCGRGVISRLLARRYPDARVDAIDLDRETQESNSRLAARMGLGNCIFRCADLIGFENPDTYDLIVSVDNLEHVADDQGVMRRFFKSMRQGGVLLVHVPHYYRRWPVFRRDVNFDVPGHVRPGYRMEDIEKLIEGAGFTVINKGFSYGFLENLANNISYSITGAREQRRYLYALLFPFLNLVAWFGQWGHPGFGAGVWVVARK